MTLQMRDTSAIIRAAIKLYFEPITFWLFNQTGLNAGNTQILSPKRVSITSLISQELTIEGNINAKQMGLRIDGKFVGNICTEEGFVVIGPTATIQGDVEAGFIIVAGTVRGNLSASLAIELHPTAIVEGDVRTAVLEMHSGAAVRGLMHASADPRSAAFEELREEVRELSKVEPSLRRVK